MTPAPPLSVRTAGDFASREARRETGTGLSEEHPPAESTAMPRTTLARFRGASERALVPPDTSKKTNLVGPRLVRPGKTGVSGAASESSPRRPSA